MRLRTEWVVPVVTGLLKKRLKGGCRSGIGTGEANSKALFGSNSDEAQFRGMRIAGGNRFSQQLRRLHGRCLVKTVEKEAGHEQRYSNRRRNFQTAHGREQHARQASA